jgi:hypothetical protein
MDRELVQAKLVQAEDLMPKLQVVLRDQAPSLQVAYAAVCGVMAQIICLEADTLPEAIDMARRTLPNLETMIRINFGNVMDARLNHR